MTDGISLDESMNQCFLYFESAVESAARSPQEIYEEFGEHPGVAWELRQELLSGRPLLTWSGVTSKEQELIRDLISKVEAMPPNAFIGAGVQDLLDPSWEKVRKTAREFMESHYI